MKRREFLLRGAALTVGTTLATQWTAAEEMKKGPKLGLTTYMIGKQWTIPELIEFLPKFGIFAVELRTDFQVIENDADYLDYRNVLLWFDVWFGDGRYGSVY